MPTTTVQPVLGCSWWLDSVVVVMVWLALVVVNEVWLDVVVVGVASRFWSLVGARACVSSLDILHPRATRHSHLVPDMVCGL